jgi:hypothetical protein
MKLFLKREEKITTSFYLCCIFFQIEFFFEGKMDPFHKIYQSQKVSTDEWNKTREIHFKVPNKSVISGHNSKLAEQIITQKKIVSMRI